MSKVDKLIESLMEVYFDEDNTGERYKIFEKVERAMKKARAVTLEQIENNESINKLVSSTDMSFEDAKALVQMSEVIAKAAMLDGVLLTRNTTFQQISEMGCIDSLDMVELTMIFEEILDVEIGGEPPEPTTTIGDILDLRK